MTYDAAGNETRYFATRTYSPRNLMSSIAEDSEDNRPHTVSYGYDGRGVRVVRSEGTTGTGTPFANRYYVYSPELNLLATSVDDNPNIWGKRGISNVTPAMKSEFLWYNGRPVGQLDGQTVRYTFTDHLGTPILQTDLSSTVIWRAEYEPYGDTYLLRAGTTAAEQPLRFPGQEYERKWEGAEERYNIFRWYRAAWGRYTQEDPLGLAGSINSFAYAGQNPQTLIDPFYESDCQGRFSSLLIAFSPLQSAVPDRRRMTVSAADQEARLWLPEQDPVSRGHSFSSRWPRPLPTVSILNPLESLKRELITEYGRRPCNPPLGQEVRQWAGRQFPDDDFLVDSYWQTVWDNLIHGPSASPQGPMLVPPIGGVPVPIPIAP
ncbi:MAG TPA: RHS repeat-associated core domain-containing protein [Vicinamibacterales bacterium]|nr:RHS repeat-associated core domain-containing protein [Vicinamibacterales bacterium]